MYFSGLLFLFLYLPLVLGAYYLVPKRFRNGFLLFVNMIFYGWGEPTLILIMAVSIMTNYTFGLLMEKYSDSKRLKKVFLICSAVISLGLLGVFKYAGFFTDILRQIPIFAAMPRIKLSLPIGISFYTFQAMSYSIDVYRGDTKAQKSLVSFGTYVSFFPQLVAGPIVRYKDIERQLAQRHENISQFADGVRVFLIGLGKKVLIANHMGALWDQLRPISDSGGTAAAWIGIFAYTMQIYFDFSGYSDMAVGLGRMFGFEFMRNFNYPYIAKSITDFWRRWHISLSGWFRDYVYIPLGGNRCKVPRHIFNLFVVWFLTGFWHGASVNFILWGIYYFVLLVLEKYVIGKYLEKLPCTLCRIYAMFFVMLGWALFYFEDLGELAAYLGCMFKIHGGADVWDTAVIAVSHLPLILVSAAACTPLGRWLYEKVKVNRFYGAFEIVFLTAIFVLCTASLAADSYNPFLYFRF